MAAASAVALSFAAYVPYTFPVFLKAISDEFSWSREQMSTAYGISAAMVALCADAARIPGRSRRIRAGRSGLLSRSLASPSRRCPC